MENELDIETELNKMLQNITKDKESEIKQLEEEYKNMTKILVNEYEKK